ncbi:MAG: glycosyl transferase family 2 [Rhodobacteraceae bacterium]|nr:MAG: glycosyl transferase family 2 [Paracoccaceae bacterium]
MRLNHNLWLAYKLRWRRRKLLLKSFRSRHQLSNISDKTDKIKPHDILGYSTVRNEILRLPYFLKHCRKLGVTHFFFVDNNSDDGTTDYLKCQPDVSLWGTTSSYKESRFGVNWLTHLQTKYGDGHWCLTLDADEIFIYPDWENRKLDALTAWLDARGQPALATLMLDIYPKGPIGHVQYKAGDDPCQSLGWFDVENYTWEMQPKYQNISIRGGARKRMFFEQKPDLAPHLHKIPLVKWRKSYAYVSSTHIALPRHLNAAFDARLDLPTGVLLHTKFLNVAVEKSQEEKRRREHFTHTYNYDDYYDEVIADPNFWHEGASELEGSQKLVDIGLMSGGAWLN